MDKNQFISAVARRLGDCEDNVRRQVNAVLGVIGDAMRRKESVVLDDFGRFFVKRIPQKTFYKNKNGETEVVPEHDKAAFKANRNITSYSEKYRR